MKKVNLTEKFLLLFEKENAKYHLFIEKTQTLSVIQTIQIFDSKIQIKGLDRFNKPSFGIINLSDKKISRNLKNEKSIIITVQKNKDEKLYTIEKDIN